VPRWANIAHSRKKQCILKGKKNRTFTRSQLAIVIRMETFDGYPVGVLGRDAWRAGAPNSKIDISGAQVNADSLCLTAGDPYEVEAAVSPLAAAARALAVTQDLSRAAIQLTPPVDPSVLYERRSTRVICLATAGLRALFLDGAAAADFGISYGAGLAALDEAAARRRAALRQMRQRGWRGPIVLPGLNPRAQTLLIPGQGLRGGALRVIREASMLEPAPRSAVEFLLGRRGDLPESSDIPGDALIWPKSRVVTISWRPANLLSRTRR
jgi:hypothetical protein